MRPYPQGMERLNARLGLKDPSPLELLEALVQYGVPLGLLREGEEAVLAYMDAYGPTVRVEAEAMLRFLREAPGDPMVRAALAYLAQDVELPEAILKEVLAKLEGKGLD